MPRLRLVDGAIPAAGSVSSSWMAAESLRAFRGVVLSKGADVTVKLEASTDDAHASVYEVATLTGVGAVLDAADRYVRLTATNGGITAQGVDVALHGRR